MVGGVWGDGLYGVVLGGGMGFEHELEISLEPGVVGGKVVVVNGIFGGR